MRGQVRFAVMRLKGNEIKANLHNLQIEQKKRPTRKTRIGHFYLSATSKSIERLAFKHKE